MNSTLELPEAKHSGSTEGRVISITKLLEHFFQVRSLSKKVCESLELEDYVIQNMPEDSPRKWHLGPYEPVI